MKIWNRLILPLMKDSRTELLSSSWLLCGVSHSLHCVPRLWNQGAEESHGHLPLPLLSTFRWLCLQYISLAWGPHGLAHPMSTSTGDERGWLVSVIHTRVSCTLITWQGALLTTLNLNTSQYLYSRVNFQHINLGNHIQTMAGRGQGPNVQQSCREKTIK